MRNSSLPALFLTMSAALSAQDGGALYRQHCASCHDGGVGRAPQPAALKQMSPENVQDDQKGYMSVTHGAIPDVNLFVTAAEDDIKGRRLVQKVASGRATPARTAISECRMEK